MKESSVDVAPRIRASERVVVHVDSAAARWIGALALLSAACWLIVVIVRGHQHADWQATSRLGWSLTVLAAVALIARGIFLGRPVTARHAVFAVIVLFTGLAAHVLSFDLLGGLLIAGSGLALMWPTTVHPRADDLPRVWALINATSGDPLAPFAMQVRKCYHFSVDGTAALAYCTRIGYAVVSGDPIGAEAQFPQLVADFAAMCRTRGWRIVVLCCSEYRRALWSDPAVIGQSLRAVPVGRDVVIDVGDFEMVGRKFRNLRQAVKRTHNCGITTEIVAEQE
ncbi:MAG: phosphatidylglycerol lysyltransferase domain-containing protein, partial [Mycobacterium sp.]